MIIHYTYREAVYIGEYTLTYKDLRVDAAMSMSYFSSVCFDGSALFEFYCK